MVFIDFEIVYDRVLREVLYSKQSNYVLQVMTSLRTQDEVVKDFPYNNTIALRVNFESLYLYTCLEYAY